MPEPTIPYKLTDLVYQQQDATVFNGAAIPSIAGSAEAFIVFYLSREDEQNGYGTVIQLDNQTKQAAIFADLNPEYSYLFYKDEQGVLQTLLWCIEFATRTPDGLFVTQAKVYGRGISEQELRQLAQQQAQPNQPYAMAEPVAPIQAQPANQPIPEPTPEPMPSPTPIAPAASAIPNPPAPEPLPVVEPVTPQPMPSQHSLSAMEQPSQAMQPAEPSLNLTPLTDLPQAPAMPQAAWDAPVDNGPASVLSNTSATPATTDFAIPAAPAMMPEPELNLPPLAKMPNNQTMPAGPTVTSPLAAAEPKQPVGRPPKPLLEDRLWMISAEDFTWLKAISREPIEANKEMLRQKIIAQIRINQPALLEDWQFLGRFDQAFSALCLTYNLVPGLRHDLLKSLLNGRVIDGVAKQT